jgi:hypothetical protein
MLQCCIGELLPHDPSLPPIELPPLPAHWKKRDPTQRNPIVSKGKLAKRASRSAEKKAYKAARNAARKE